MVKYHSIIKNSVLGYSLPLFGILLSLLPTSGHSKPLKVTSLSGTVVHTKIVSHKLKPGESLNDLVYRLQPSKSEAHGLVSMNANGTRVATISTNSPSLVERLSRSRGYQAGELSTYRDKVRLFYANGGRSRFFINPQAGLQQAPISTKYFRRTGIRPIASAQGVVRSTLAAAGSNAGLSEDVMEQLARIFAWDIDFATDLSPGDRFTVVYERGGYDSSDEIVSAEFVNQGRVHRAVRFIDKNGNMGYYTPEGHAMQKSFLSTPVEYARISSHFDLNRRHPILNTIRAHKGVDYAARAGTPIKATGNGQVTFVGNKGGYGQVVIISHGQRYETLYAHMSKFKSGLQTGQSVHQGEVIGYVGQTGLATGPHLHYEFRVDGEHRNPLTVTAQLSRAIPLNGVAMNDFKKQAQRYLAQLNQVKSKTLYAKSNNTHYD